MPSSADETWQSQANLILSRRLSREYNLIFDNYKLDRYIKPATLALSKSQVNMGEWHKTTRVISISLALCEKFTWQEIVEVIKHETAHQLSDEHFIVPPSEGVHGQTFQKACELICVAPWARSARVHKQPGAPSLSELCADDDSPLEIKIKKLLNLSTSSNEHEAQLALAKARELSAKYQKSFLREATKTPHIHSLSISLNRKRRSEFDSFLAMVLSEYFRVKTIFTYEWSQTRMHDTMVLDLVGLPKDLLMAEHVYYYLQQTFEYLWNNQKKRLSEDNKMPHSMRVAKNSYYTGLMRGFAKNLKAAIKEEKKVKQPLDKDPDQQSALAMYNSLAKKQDAKLDDYLIKKYPRMQRRNYSSRRMIDKEQIKAGEREGGKVSVRKTINASDGNQKKLLS
ncbi:MAG: DUF2786 domain-containing protein [Proteobacteria bacterium]|nr:DUF2786 domain-containing protein [Pseudomonadota bacterium]